MKYRKPLNALIIVLVIFGLLLLVRFVLPYLQISCMSNGGTLVTKAEENGKTKEQIYRLLADRYFNQFKSGFCLSDRLDDYRIDQLTVTESGFSNEFSMEYSVKPAFPGDASWIAGNGRDDGTWIVKKFGFVSVKETADGLGISAINTGP